MNTKYAFTLQTPFRTMHCPDLYHIRCLPRVRDRCLFPDSEGYAGQRVRRGLIAPGNGTAINAGVNAACNNIRKVFPDAFGERIWEVSLHPACRDLFSACQCT